MRKEITYIVPAGTSMTLQQALRGPMQLTCRQVRSAKFRENGILVNEERSRVSRVLRGGDEVRVLLEDLHDPSQVRSIRENPGDLPPLKEEEILYEDEDLLLINKQAGICVHPSHGHYADTLADQVCARYRGQGITEIPRIIGRLDKETSGLVLFARNKVAAQRLSEGCLLRKEYLAVVHGRLTCSPVLQPSRVLPPSQIPQSSPVLPPSADAPVSFTITCPIARDPSSLNRMLADPEGILGGRAAVTHLQVLSYDAESDASLLRLWLETGRTHQIRVHMAYAGHPLLGDTLYGPQPHTEGTLHDLQQHTEDTLHGPLQHTEDTLHDPLQLLPEDEKSAARFFHRAALHCFHMELIQPFTGKKLRIRAPLPGDLAEYLYLQHNALQYLMQ